MKKIHIAWNTVNWYSQIVAVVLFVGIFVLGFYLGQRYEYHAFVNAINGGPHLNESDSVPFHKKVRSSMH